MISRAHTVAILQRRQTPVISLRVFAYLLTVLSLVYLVFDLAVGGPIASWGFEVAVVRPVESRYGFDAEWLTVGAYEQLQIVSITPGGAFDRAGVRPGYAFAPARCGWFALSGGWYNSLREARRELRVRLLTKPGDFTSESTFVVRPPN